MILWSLLSDSKIKARYIFVCLGLHCPLCSCSYTSCSPFNFDYICALVISLVGIPFNSFTSYIGSASWIPPSTVLFTLHHFKEHKTSLASWERNFLRPYVLSISLFKSYTCLFIILPKFELNISLYIPYMYLFVYNFSLSIIFTYLKITIY